MTSNYYELPKLNAPQPKHDSDFSACPTSLPRGSKWRVFHQGGTYRRDRISHGDARKERRASIALRRELAKAHLLNKTA